MREEIINHLECLGYGIEKYKLPVADLDAYFVSIDNFPCFTFMQFDNTAMFRCTIDVFNISETKIRELASYINELNKQTFVSKFIYDNEYIEVKSCYLAPYNKDSFLFFINAYLSDIKILKDKAFGDYEDFFKS